MEVTVIDKPGSQKELKLTLPWAEWSGHIDEAAEHLAQKVKTPGFRPGKTPRKLLEQQFGADALLGEAAEIALNHAYPKALAEQHLQALGHPHVDLGTVAKEEDLLVTVLTDVLPTIEIGDWREKAKAINKEFARKKSDISDEKVTEEIERIAKMRAPLVTVNRVAQNGDTVMLDFTVKQDGVVIENGKSENHPLVLGTGAFIPGFEEEVIGMKAEEKKTFTLTFPAEYHAKHLAGKDASFEVGVRAVQEAQMPEINDDFAHSAGDFKDLAALRENIRAGMAEEEKAARKNEHRTALLDALVASVPVELPQTLLDQELERIKHEFSQHLGQMGVTFEAFLDQMKKGETELYQEWEPQAKKRVTAYLILDAIAADEKVFTESEEVEAEMNKALQYFKDIKDAEKNLDMTALYTVVSEQLRNEKIFAMLESAN